MTHEDMVEELRTAAARVEQETEDREGFVCVVLLTVARMLDKERVTTFGRACAAKTLRNLREDIMDGRTLLDWCRDEDIKLFGVSRREGIALAYSLADDAIKDVLTQLEAQR